MSSEIWSEKATLLHSELDNLNSALLDGLEDNPTRRQELEVATIARFLRRNFSDDPPEDTATILLFPTVQSAAPNRRH